MVRSIKTPLLLGCLLSAAVLADPPRPDDFAFGFPIETPGEAAMWRLSLPESVYRNVTRADLGDLRVFDRSGNTMPYMLRRPELWDAEAPAAVELPFFPLHGNSLGSDAKHSMRIVTNERGAIVNLVSDAPVVMKPGPVQAYLIDATALERIPIRLTLSWEGSRGGEAEAGFATSLSVDSSDDFVHWRTLVAKAGLAALSFGDAKLTHREIALPPRKAKYLRLEWPAELREIRITAIQALLPGERKPPPRHWLKLSDGTMKPEQVALEFDSGGHWPVDRVRLAFPTRNAVLKAALESRAGPDVEWRSRYRGLFYRLEHKGAELAGDPVKIAPTADPRWRLRPAAGAGWPNGAAPALELGWAPHELTFVAQGEPPYTLAFGSAVVGPSAQPVDALLGMLGEEREPALIQPAQLSQQTVLGGQQRLQPLPPPLPWKQWLLWAVLVLGVALLAWMVRQLIRQLGEGG